MKSNAKTFGAFAIVLLAGSGIGYLLPHGNVRGASSGVAAAARGTYTPHGNQIAGGVLTGSIAKTGNGSLTLNTRDGSSRLILLTPDTVILKSVQGTTTDLTQGADALITGSANSDGSISAQTIDVRPAGSAPRAPGTNAPMIPVPRPQ